ncbi:outer membrane receptor protein involved in Fe transport [Bradyrhizobium sp. USDA 4011]
MRPARAKIAKSQGAAGTVGTKTNTALIETPQSLSVVTQKELRDRNVQTLKDAVNYTPGVTTTAFGYDPRSDSFYIRGFDATHTGIYRDGLRQGGGNFAIPKIEPYDLDSVSTRMIRPSALWIRSNTASVTRSSTMSTTTPGRCGRTSASIRSTPTRNTPRSIPSTAAPISRRAPPGGSWIAVTLDEGLGLGLGVRYIGTNFGNDQNTARTLFDAVIDYDLGKLDRRFLDAHTLERDQSVRHALPDLPVRLLLCRRAASSDRHLVLPLVATPARAPPRAGRPSGFRRA